MINQLQEKARQPLSSPGSALDQATLQELRTMLADVRTLSSAHADQLAAKIEPLAAALTILSDDVETQLKKVVSDASQAQNGLIASVDKTNKALQDIAAPFLKESFSLIDSAKRDHDRYMKEQQEMHKRHLEELGKAAQLMHGSLTSSVGAAKSYSDAAALKAKEMRSLDLWKMLAIACVTAALTTVLLDWRPPQAGEMNWLMQRTDQIAKRLGVQK
jgi:hypothetical protein